MIRPVIRTILVSVLLATPAQAQTSDALNRLFNLCTAPELNGGRPDAFCSCWRQGLIDRVFPSDLPQVQARLDIQRGQGKKLGAATLAVPQLTALGEDCRRQAGLLPLIAAPEVTAPRPWERERPPVAERMPLPPTPRPD
jgi:hypothetical protein